jgi:predicted ATPase/SAM-dependent methyltransferase
MISSITIPNDIAAHEGLKSVELRDLSQVVILAGPNGGGKSRYLRAIARTFERATTARAAVPSQKETLKQRTQELEQSRAWALRPDDVAPPHSGEDWAERDRQVRHDKRHHQRRVEELSTEVQKLEENGLAQSLVRFSDEHQSGAKSPSLILLRYPSNERPMSNAENLAPTALHAALQQLDSGGFDSVHGNVHAYLSSVASTLWRAGHHEEQSKAGIQRRLEDVGQLNLILGKLLSTSLNYEATEGSFVHPVLRGRIFKQSELSDGEKILLTWAVTLHKQREDLAGSIVLIDEPETYLHPDACIKALEGLQQLIGRHGQIWIATHSVPLIAFGGMESVYFIKGHEASFARNKLDDLVCSLLGGPDGRMRLHAMLLDADKIAAARFLAECLIAPNAVDTHAECPQKLMFRQVVDRAIAGNEPLRILDFGAGRGRLAAALANHDHSAEIEYFAYCPLGPDADGDRAACLRRIGDVNHSTSSDNFYWDNLAALETQEGASFNMVVLCNVLHEIDPNDWLDTISSVDRLLSDDGVLVVMEDLTPAIGEMPHPRGYLVLDVFALRRLFRDAEGVQMIREAKQGRLTAVEVPKASLRHACADSRNDAIDHVLQCAKKEAKQIRRDTGPRSAESGRRHAHLMMQIVNALFAQEQFGSVPSHCGPDAAVTSR